MAVACLAVVAGGCGDGRWQAPTYPATGRLVVNGKPAAGALVHLHPEGAPVDARSSRPWAKVQSDGTFTLTTYELDDGAPAGSYQVTLVWPEDTSRPSLFDRLDRKFDEPEESKWTVTVTEGDNTLPPIEIDGVRLIDPPRNAPAPPM